MSVENDPEPTFRDPRNPTRDELRAHGLWRLRNPGRIGPEAPFTREEQELAGEACLQIARERTKSEN
jgi:hypothetical protein